MTKQKKNTNKQLKKNPLDFGIIFWGLVLFGILYWDNKDIKESFLFSFFVVGGLYVNWNIVYFYIVLKRNDFKLKRFYQDVGIMNILYVLIVIILSAIILPKLLLYLFFGCTIGLQVLLLIVDLIRGLFQK